MGICGKPVMFGGSGGGTIYESINRWEMTMLDGYSEGSQFANLRSNNSIVGTWKTGILAWHITGSFSNTSLVSIGWEAPKATIERFAGKYLNLKMSGSISNVRSIEGIIQALVSPYTMQAYTTQSTKKCLISSFPNSYSTAFIGVQVAASSGNTIDAYFELTITDD